MGNTIVSITTGAGCSGRFPSGVLKEHKKRSTTSGKNVQFSPEVLASCEARKSLKNLLLLKEEIRKLHSLNADLLYNRVVATERIVLLGLESIGDIADKQKKQRVSDATAACQLYVDISTCAIKIAIYNRKINESVDKAKKIKYMNKIENTINKVHVMVRNDRELAGCVIDLTLSLNKRYK